MRYGDSMKSSVLFSTPRNLAISFLLLSSSVVLAQKDQKPAKPTPTPNSTVTPRPTATPKPSPTPETKIDARTEAQLLQAEDRFINAIRNHDAKELEQLLHPQYADSIGGRESAVGKTGVIRRAAGSRLPAYRIEKDRKLTRYGNDFNVEGLARNAARDDSVDTSSEWVHIRRLWTREGDRWIATAQIVTPENEEAERENFEEKQKPK